MNLRAVGEEKLLRRILPHLPLNRAVVSGAGDDCAVVKFDDKGDNFLDPTANISRVRAMRDFVNRMRMSGNQCNILSSPADADTKAPRPLENGSVLTARTV